MDLSSFVGLKDMRRKICIRLPIRFIKNRKNKVKTRRRKPKASSEESTSDKRKAQGGTGAVAILTKLATTDFFDKPKTINDILEHCKDNLARTFKANEFSGKLGRMVRGKELKREKNADNQYEYKKP